MRFFTGVEFLQIAFNATSFIVFGIGISHFPFISKELISPFEEFALLSNFVSPFLQSYSTSCKSKESELGMLILIQVVTVPLAARRMFES